MEAVNSQTDTDLNLFHIQLVNDENENYLRTTYNKFLTEAFDFYEINEKIWKDCEADPLYYLLEEKPFYYFTLPIRQAIATAAYIYRRKYRGYFNKDMRLLKHIDAFIPSDFCYSLRIKVYFLDFFYWIAYVFELKLFCKIHKFDFKEICKSRFSNYLGLSSFKAGVLCNLENVCGPLTCLYYPLVETFHGNYPSCDIFLPFNLAKRIVDREFKYDNMFRYFVLLHNTVDDTYKNLSKLHALSSYKPKRIVLGYKSRNMITPQGESKTTSNESSEKDRNLHRSERTQECTELSIDATSRKSNPNRKAPLEFDDTKSFFAVSNRYLSKRQEARLNSYESKYKRDIKLYSITNGNTELVEGLMNVLDKNIEKDNLYKITDKLFAVYPSNSDVNFGDKIVILDTSSEDEEDNQLDPPQLLFKRSLILELKNWKYCIENNSESLKFLHKIREILKYTVQDERPRDEETDINTKSKEDIQEEMKSIEQNLAIGKKKKRLRKKKRQEKISMESTKVKSPEAKYVDPNFEISKITELPGNTKEEISVKNTGAERDSIKQANEYKSESPEYIIGNNLPAFKMHKTKSEDHITTKSVFENYQKKEISLDHTKDKGRNSIELNLETSDTVSSNHQNEDNSVGNTGTTLKTQKPMVFNKKYSKESTEKTKISSETIQLPMEDEHLMNSIIEIIKLHEKNREGCGQYKTSFIRNWKVLF